MRPSTTAALIFGLPLAIALGPRLLATAAAPDPDEWVEELVADWVDGSPPQAVLDQRVVNPEYDLMSRTFLSLALADRALAEGASEADRDEAVLAMDAMIADTWAQVERGGHRTYLLGYADARPWQGGGRSLFVDGELLVMMGARRMVQEGRWQEEMGTLAAAVEGSFGSATALPLAESYPDEGWTFCHTMAHLGLRMHEVLDGADHHSSREAFLAWARDGLVEPGTGMLSSEFDLHGKVNDGPEGSSIWFSVAALSVLDPPLAAEQYALAREELGRSVLGLGYAREWPVGLGNASDVDSGPIVPGLEASASSSGLAIGASRALGDERWHGQLVAALGAAEILMAGLPPLAEMADNPVGKSVIVWGMGVGPLFERIALEEAPQGTAAARG